MSGSFPRVLERVCVWFVEDPTSKDCLWLRRQRQLLFEIANVNVCLVRIRQIWDSIVHGGLVHVFAPLVHVGCAQSLEKPTFYLGVPKDFILALII